MARQLPGMYWDHERQRYFPLAFRKAQQVPARSVQQVQPFLPEQSTGAPRCRSLPSLHHALSNLRSVLGTAHKESLIHQIQSSRISLTDEVARSNLPIEGFFSAFQTVCHGGRVWTFAGDTSGWFYSSVVDKDREETDTSDGWHRQFHLSSEVSSIGVSGTTCVATSFGPECRILHVPLHSPPEEEPNIHVTRIDGRLVHDVWTTDLQGSRLVLGASKQAVVIEDIALCTPLKRLPTKSDVLALAQRENVFYTGLRNGSILRFDSRKRGSCIYPLFDSVAHRASSITGLKHLRDHQLVASFIDGRISTLDLRFPIRTPVMTFSDHVNSYTTRLPLATDPNERFLFAAGQDNRIRVWSLITGGAALGPGGTEQKLFQPFEHHVASLQIVDEGGLCLWAASGRELCKYRSGVGVQQDHGG